MRNGRSTFVFVCVLGFAVKGIVHPKMKITHPHIIPNHNRRYSVFFPAMIGNVVQLTFWQKRPYRFGAA